MVKATVTNRVERGARDFFVKFSKRLVPTMRRSFSRSLRGLQSDFTKERLSGSPGVNRRTGQLARSLTVRVNNPPRINDLRGEIFFTNPVAAYLEFGATIKAKAGGWLTVPLSDALTPSGVPRRPNARAWDNTFFFRSKKGNLLLAKRRGKTRRSKLLLLYVLKKIVYLRAQLGWRKAVKAWRPDASAAQVKSLRGLIRSLKGGK